MDNKFKDLLEDEELVALRLAALASKKRKLENAENSSDSISALPINSIISSSASVSETASNQIPFVQQSDRNAYNNYAWRKQNQPSRRRGSAFPKNNQRSNLIVISPVSLNDSKDSDEKVPALILPQHKWCNSGNEDSMSPKTLRRTGPIRFNRHDSDSESSDSDYENSENDSGSNETVLQDEPPEHFSCLSPKADVASESIDKQRRLSFQNLENEIKSDAFEKSETTSVYNCLKSSSSHDYSKNKSDDFIQVQNLSDNRCDWNTSVDNNYSSYKPYNNLYSSDSVKPSEGFSDKQNNCVMGNGNPCENSSLVLQSANISEWQHTGVKSSNSYYSTDISVPENTRNHLNDRASMDYTDKRQPYPIGGEVQACGSLVWEHGERNRTDDSYFSRDVTYSKAMPRNFASENINSNEKLLSGDDLRFELKKRMHSLENNNEVFDHKKSDQGGSWDRKKGYTYNEGRFGEGSCSNSYRSEQGRQEYGRNRDDYRFSQNRRRHHRSLSREKNKSESSYGRDRNRNDFNFSSEKNRYDRSSSLDRNRTDSSSIHGRNRNDRSLSRGRHERSSSHGKSRRDRSSSWDRKYESGPSKGKRKHDSSSLDVHKSEKGSSVERKKHDYRSSQEKEKLEHSVDQNTDRGKHNWDRSPYEQRSSPNKKRYTYRSGHDRSRQERRARRNHSRSDRSSSPDSRSDRSSSSGSRRRSYSRDRRRREYSSSEERSRHRHSRSRSKSRQRKSLSQEKDRYDHSHSHKRNSHERSPSRDSHCEHSPSHDRSRKDRSSSHETKKSDYDLNKEKSGDEHDTRNKHESDSTNSKKNYKSSASSDKKFDADIHDGKRSEKSESDKMYEKTSSKDHFSSEKKGRQNRSRSKEKYKESERQSNNVSHPKYKDRYSRSRSSSTSSCSSSSSSSSTHSSRPKIRSVPSVVKSIPPKTLNVDKKETFCEIKIMGKNISTSQQDVSLLSSRKDVSDINKASNVKSGRFDSDSKVSDNSKRVPVHMRLGAFPRKRLIQMPKDVEAAFVNSSSGSEGENVNTKCKRQNIRIVTNYGTKAGTDCDKKLSTKDKSAKRSPEPQEKPKRLKTNR